MREILFRGKCKLYHNYETEKDVFGWVYGVPYIDCDGDYVLANEGGSSIVVPETVGQYTGLTDKNGTRIFEGDIVKNIDGNEIGVVRWYSEYAALTPNCSKRIEF